MSETHTTSRDVTIRLYPESRHGLNACLRRVAAELGLPMCITERQAMQMIADNFANPEFQGLFCRGVIESFRAANPNMKTERQAS